MNIKRQQCFASICGAIAALGCSQAGGETESIGFGDGRPESGSAADGAVAAIGALGEVKVGLERHRPTVATTSVCLEHWRPFAVRGFPAQLTSALRRAATTPGAEGGTVSEPRLGRVVRRCHH